MKLQYRVASVAAITLLFASVSLAQHTKTDYDHSAHFGQYKTYSWGRVQTQNPLWENRIKDAVNNALSSKGMTMVASGGDLTVVAMGTTQDKQTLETYYDGMGGWMWRGFGESTTTVETYRVGTLVVDMFDSNTKRLVWRGSSSGTLSNKTDKNIKTLDKDVQSMFEHFPPGS